MAGWSNRRLRVIIFLMALTAYLAVGYWLQVQNGFIMGDALAAAGIQLRGAFHKHTPTFQLEPGETVHLLEQRSRPRWTFLRAQRAHEHAREDAGGGECEQGGRNSASHSWSYDALEMRSRARRGSTYVYSTCARSVPLSGSAPCRGGEGLTVPRRAG